MEFVTQGSWAEAERQLAKRFGLKIYPATGRLMELLTEEVQQSDFIPAKILAEFESNSALITEFGARWYADCHGLDYGEEWDPEEGNQQADNPPAKTMGIGQGFLVGYTLFFLYAKSNPDGLLDFIKRRRIPHATKVAKDVVRVFGKTIKTDA